MEIQHSNTLKIHKLSTTQLKTAENSGTLDSTALYLTPAGTLTINVNNAKVGDFDGTEDKTINISCEVPGHTHPCSLATDSGSPTVNLAHSSTYKLTAGGNSVIFKMPASGNVDTKVNQTAVSSGTTDYYLLASAQSSPSSGSAYEAKYNTNIKLNGSGQLTAKTVKAESFTATSDKRLKENLIPYSASKSILELPVYTYNFIADETNTKHIGCLAQDLGEICPELVKEDSEGYLSINESKIVYLLLEEVKKLKAEVEQLKQQL